MSSVGLIEICLKRIMICAGTRKKNLKTRMPLNPAGRILYRAAREEL